jgi:tellurite methyltransferase
MSFDPADVQASEHLATAHEVWDRNWSDPAQRARWLEPEPLVHTLAGLLRARGLGRVLDVGCGLGRHTRFLASEGFQCTGVDASPAGLDYARAEATAAGLDISYQQSAFYELPFPDASFDAVIAWNVIYHGNGVLAQRAADEFARVLEPRGLYVGTLLSKRNAGYGRGREVSQDTFVVDDAADDKVRPHLYVDAATVLRLHSGFELLVLRNDEQSPGANHWQFLFERLAA